MIMTPIEMPQMNATNEELAGWLRQFSEEYNMLLDRLHGVLDAAKKDGRGEAQKQLRDYLEKNPIVEDTGWVAVRSFGANFQNFYTSAQPAEYRKIGSVVYLRGLVKPTATLPSTDGTNYVHYVIFTLPEKLRPREGAACSFVCQGERCARWQLTVRANGEVTFSRYADENGLMSATSEDTWLSFCVSFPVG